MSWEMDVDFGMPQATVLNPLQYLAFITDLPKVVDCSIKLFADDFIINLHDQRIHPTTKVLSALDKWEKD